MTGVVQSQGAAVEHGQGLSHHVTLMRYLLRADFSFGNSHAYNSVEPKNVAQFQRSEKWQMK